MIWTSIFFVWHLSDAGSCCNVWRIWTVPWRSWIPVCSWSAANQRMPFPNSSRNGERRIWPSKRIRSRSAACETIISRHFARSSVSRWSRKFRTLSTNWTSKSEKLISYQFSDELTRRILLTNYLHNINANS